MKTQIDIYRTTTSGEAGDESRFSSFRYELENGARYAQFAVVLLALSAILLALALLFFQH